VDNAALSQIFSRVLSTAAKDLAGLEKPKLNMKETLTGTSFSRAGLSVPQHLRANTTFFGLASGQWFWETCSPRRSRMITATKRELLGVTDDATVRFAFE